jgi:hypothetical protein
MVAQFELRIPGTPGATKGKHEEKQTAFKAVCTYTKTVKWDLTGNITKYQNKT